MNIREKRFSVVKITNTKIIVMLITSTVRICYKLILGDVVQSGGSWWEQCGTGVGEDLKALGKRDE